MLYQKVNGHLKVEEADYFGLQYYDSEGNMVSVISDFLFLYLWLSL